MRLRGYKKKKIGSYITCQIMIIVVGIIFALLIVNHYAKRFNEVILPIAVAETRKYMTVLINNAAKGVIFDKNLFVIEKEKEEIKMISYNTYEATKLINEITFNIQDKLDKDLVIREIPLGLIFKNSLMRNFGPKIKVKIGSISDIISELETEVKPYGINNAMIEVKVHIIANARVVLPLTSNEIKINNMIPISVNIINGNIPEAYFMTYK